MLNVLYLRFSSVQWSESLLAKRISVGDFTLLSFRHTNIRVEINMCVWTCACTYICAHAWDHVVGQLWMAFHSRRKVHYIHLFKLKKWRIWIMEVEWLITFSMDICDWFFQKVELTVLKVWFFSANTINEQLFAITCWEYSVGIWYFILGKL